VCPASVTICIRDVGKTFLREHLTLPNYAFDSEMRASLCKMWDSNTLGMCGATKQSMHRTFRPSRFVQPRGPEPSKVLHGRETMGDDDQGGGGKITADILKDKCFRGGVETGSGFVQNKNLRAL